MDAELAALRERSRIEPEHLLARIDRLRALCAGRGYDGVLLLDTWNVVWASGWPHIPSERPIGYYVPAAGRPVLFVPQLEVEHAAAAAGDIRTYWEFPGVEPPELWMLRQIGGGRIALDGGAWSVVERLRSSEPRLVVEPAIARLRYRKSEPELARTELAARYADYALDVARRSLLDGVRSEITELDVVRAVQSAVTTRMQREVAELVDLYRGAVTLTVHTGSRAALPHGRPGPVAIRAGDTVIAGVGVRVGGYHAESGCTFVIGDATPEQLRCLRAGWACDEAALAALRPGATCEAVDAAGLDVLRAAGFGAEIRHRIGHGMGLQGHEAPWLSAGDSTVLEPGMIFSNEPGIYRPGRDGYRIIDSMLVTPTGGRRLSRYLEAHGPEDRVVPL